MGDGETNDEAAIREAVSAVGDADGFGTVYFPPGTYMVQPRGGKDTAAGAPDPERPDSKHWYAMRARSNMQFVFDQGATIKALPHELTHGYLLMLHDVENVRIIGGTFDFSRAENKSDGGEWGHCITIRNARNVKIVDTTCKNAWGDGINVKMLPDGPDIETTENIVVDRYHGQNNRRQGISVLSAKDFWLVNSLIEGTGGTAPGAAIDLEPALIEHQLHNITIQNLHSIDNEQGLKVAPIVFTRAHKEHHLDMAPDDVEPTSIEVTASNLLSERDKYGIVCNGARGRLHGEIRIDSPTIVEPKQGGFNARDWEDVASKITVTDLLVRDPGGSGVKWGSAVGIFAKANTGPGTNIPPRTSKLGNVEFVNPKVTVGPRERRAPRAFFAKDYGEMGVNDVHLINPREMASEGQQVQVTNAEHFNVVDDHYEALEEY
jgi:hypothetical protein